METSPQAAVAAESRVRAPAGEDSDRELVRAFVERRSERAFRELYRRHTPRIHRFVVRLLGGRPHAEDVLQETWLRAARALADFRFEARLRTWLMGVALNVCRELSRRRELDVPIETAPAEAEGDDRRAGSPLERIDLEATIATLPAGFRQVLLLHDLEGHTHREIALLLGIEEGTSKSQLARARAALRRRWRAETSTDTTRSE